MISMRGSNRQKKTYSRVRRLARALHENNKNANVFGPINTINEILENIKCTAGDGLAGLILPQAKSVLGKRVAQLLFTSRQPLLIQEAILTQNYSEHQANLALPPFAWKQWPGKVAPFLSLKSFAILMFEAHKTGWKRIFSLISYAKNGPEMPHLPTTVFVGAPEESLTNVMRGGVLNWLKMYAPDAKPDTKVWVTRTLGWHRDKFDYPEWIYLASEPFPKMPSLFKCVLFAANAIFSGIGVSFATLFGQWQLTLLFSDWIELQYVQILGGDWQPQRVLHGLPHMANRALWVDYAESTGIPTPLLYYAASYSLIPLDASEEVSTLSSTVMMLNNWTSGWVQSRSVADYFCELLEGRRFMTHVGAFDMVDDGANLPALPERALAVFDVEPNVSATQLALAGYIISYLDEDVCVAFWQTLAAAARQHNLVLIHKPKRPMPSSKARKYDKLLKALKEEGIYYPLQPSTGACRLLQATAASIIQPFTSVADLAEDLNTNTAFLNPSGVIPNAQNYARQASVIDTKQQLDEFLSKHFPLN